MKRYLIRVVKYLLLLLVLFVVLYAIMFFMKTTSLHPSQFKELFASQKGLTLIVVFVVLSVINPLFGYAKRQLSYEATQHPEKVISVIESNGFEKVSEDDSLVKFRADSKIKKLQALYEDELILDKKEGTLEGTRRDVARLIFRIQSQMINN